MLSRHYSGKHQIWQTYLVVMMLSLYVYIITELKPKLERIPSKLAKLAKTIFYSEGPKPKPSTQTLG